MSLAMQVKLLRSLQERTVRPLGGATEVPVDVRLITATNRNLQKAVEEKAFREDLYYRISVIPVEIPPLRERSEDIPLLATHFLNEFSKKMGKHLTGLGREALAMLESYAWQGNVRELENTIERRRGPGKRRGDHSAFPARQALRTFRHPDVRTS